MLIFKGKYWNWSNVWQNTMGNVVRSLEIIGASADIIIHNRCLWIQSVPGTPKIKPHSF